MQLINVICQLNNIVYTRWFVTVRGVAYVTNYVDICEFCRHKHNVLYIQLYCIQQQLSTFIIPIYEGNVFAISHHITFTLILPTIFMLTDYLYT